MHNPRKYNVGCPLPSTKDETCPYNSNHLVRPERLQRHLIYCRRDILSKPHHPFYETALKFEICPFDANHHIHAEEMSGHMNSCPSRREVVKALDSETRKAKQPAWRASVVKTRSEEIAVSENWEEGEYKPSKENPQNAIQKSAILPEKHVGLPRGNRTASYSPAQNTQDQMYVGIYPPGYDPGYPPPMIPPCYPPPGGDFQYYQQQQQQQQQQHYEPQTYWSTGYPTVGNENIHPGGQPVTPYGYYEAETLHNYADPGEYCGTYIEDTAAYDHITPLRELNGMESRAPIEDQVQEIEDILRNSKLDEVNGQGVRRGSDGWKTGLGRGRGRGVPPSSDGRAGSLGRGRGVSSS